jgi:hypothetical protein
VNTGAVAAPDVDNAATIAHVADGFLRGHEHGPDVDRDQALEIVE